MKAKDLAKQLGVSPATISLVLNNKPGISDPLRHSLIEKIRDLGCENMLRHTEGASTKAPDRSSPSSRPVIIYLIYTSCDENNDRFAFYPAVLEGAEMEARDNNYNLVVLHMSSLGNPNLKRLVENSGDAIGAIVQASHIDHMIMQDLAAIDMPYVFLDAYRPDLKISSVCTNNEQGIFSAVAYLKEMGHRELGYVYSGLESDCQIERRRCFHQALREYGLEDNRENYFTARGSEEVEAFNQLQSMFTQAARLPTAFIAENDRLAWRTMKALERSGYKVPQQVSVIGFDDRSICTMIEPNLTSVKSYRHLMGRESVSMLKNIRRLRKLGFRDPCLKYELPTELIVRDSVLPLK